MVASRSFHISSSLVADLFAANKVVIFSQLDRDKRVIKGSG